MTKFIGQVATKPERRDGNWYFSIWNTKANKGINCISSTRFEVENCKDRFEAGPLDEVEVIGDVSFGTCHFETVTVLKRAEQTVKA